VTGTPPLTKVFINATYADEVPEQQDAEKLRGIVNCVVSDVRETADKGEPYAHDGWNRQRWTLERAAGKPSLVIDATLAPSPIQQSKRDKSYKQWLIQVILEKVEERMGVELSRSKYSSRCRSGP
jgi:type VI protein secretion system component VasK